MNDKDTLIDKLEKIISKRFFGLFAENKGTCRWEKEIDIDHDDLGNEYRRDSFKLACEDNSIYSDISKKYKYCPYCGLPIEEVKDE